MNKKPEASVPDLRAQSIRGASALMVGQGFRFAISMVSQIVLARLLIPEDFGVIAMVYPVFGFIQLFTDFGLLQAVVQRPQINRDQLSGIFWFNIAVSAILTIAFATFSPVLAWIYREPRVGPIALALSAMILVSGVSQLQGALLNRQMRFVTIVIIDIASLIVGLTAGIFCALRGGGYWALVWSQIATSVTASILTAVLSSWVPPRPLWDPEVAQMLKFGGDITGARVLGYLNVTIDNLMIGVVIGEQGLGLYDRAWRLAVQPLTQLTAPVDRLALPVLSRVQDDPDRYRSAFAQMVRMLCLLSMPALVFGIVAADMVIRTLFGLKWVSIITIFQWVCFGALISPLNMAAMWLLTSQRRSREQLKATLIVSVINVLAYASGLAWGAVGVARASALSVYLLQTPILILASTRTGPVDQTRFLQILFPIAVAVAADALVLHFLIAKFSCLGILAIPIGGGMSYVLVALVLASFPAGRRILTSNWDILSKEIFKGQLRFWRSAGLKS